MRSQQTLFNRLTIGLPPGRLQWIGLRPARREPMVEVTRVRAIAGLGLEGDRRCQGREGSARQVTLISSEFIEQIRHYLGRDALSPALLRRNLVVSGINLNALRHQEFVIGEVRLRATALCHPCRRMEEALGRGGVAAMLGHGGLCAQILTDGEIACGDRVEKIDQTVE